MKGTAIYPSPVGDIQLDWADGAVTALKNADADVNPGEPNELTRLVFRQLDEYFAGTRKTFDGRRCGKFPTAKHAAIRTSQKLSDTRKPSGQLAWQIMQIPFLSPSPATASLGQVGRLSAMAEDWK